MAALKLLVESKEIDLPAPSARQCVVGASGRIYTQSVTGVATRVMVMERVWLDKQSARIVLDDGRVVLVQLEGRGAVKENGSADAVITVKVDDPEVATWPPEKILEQATLEGGWICWERHWDDGQLHREALTRAEEEARNLLDLAPEGVTLQDGLTALQRSESVLHWVIKEILAAAGELRTPAVTEQISRRMPDGLVASRTIGLPEMKMKLTDIRVEERLGALIPDVLCRAVDEAGRFEASDLLIEVAVTHRVDDTKRQRIKELGLACVELDVNLMDEGGRMTVGRLRRMVVVDPDNKRWIHHPALEALARQAEQDLEAEAAGMEAELANERSRRSWFEQLTTEQAAREYLEVLRAWWGERAEIQEQGRPCTPRQLAELLAERDLKGLSVTQLSGKAGLLRRLDALEQGCVGTEGQESPYGHFKAVYESASDQRYVTWILLAIKLFQPRMTSEIAEAVGRGREEVKASLRRGETTYARPRNWDRAVALMFPAMAAGLNQEFGTELYAARVNRQKQAEAQRAQHEREAAREAASRAADSERLGGEIREAITRVCTLVDWGPADDGIPASADVAYFLLENWRKSNHWSDAEIKRVVFEAWDARERGVTLRAWLEARAALSVGDVEFVRLVLEKSWLVLPVRR